MKLADGFFEEEIAARLGDPAMLAAQFDEAERTPQKKSGGKPLLLGACCWAGITGVSLLMQHIMGIW